MREAATDTPVRAPATVVAERLRDRIRATGPLAFAVFMDEALYGEDGYYRQPQPPMGLGGDFITGSTSPGIASSGTASLRPIPRRS